MEVNMSCPATLRGGQLLNRNGSTPSTPHTTALPNDALPEDIPALFACVVDQASDSVALDPVDHLMVSMARLTIRYVSLATIGHFQHQTCLARSFPELEWIRTLVPWPRFACVEGCGFCRLRQFLFLFLFLFLGRSQIARHHSIRVSRLETGKIDILPVMSGRHGFSESSPCERKCQIGFPKRANCITARCLIQPRWMN